jgi:hypothetical protein
VAVVNPVCRTIIFLLHKMIYCVNLACFWTCILPCWSLLKSCVRTLCWQQHYECSFPFFLLKSHCTGCFCHYQAAICWLTEASCPRSWILSSICCTYLQSVDIPLEKLCVQGIDTGWLADFCTNSTCTRVLLFSNSTCNNTESTWTYTVFITKIGGQYIRGWVEVDQQAGSFGLFFLFLWRNHVGEHSV